jgi:hypothetical protein
MEDIPMIPSHKRPKAPERPITFRAAEDLGAFELAQPWADRTAWPISERRAYDELAELATMSALAKWLTRWQPIAIHSAVLADARMECIAGALGNSLQVAFDRWHEWAGTTRLHHQRQARHHGRRVRGGGTEVRRCGNQANRTLSCFRC